MAVADHEWIFGGVEAAWKFVSASSLDDISAVVSLEATRGNDAVGKCPRRVAVALGEEFVPRGTQLAQLRGKFGEDEGKNVFELEGVCGLAMELLWGKLLREVGRESEGPVTLALRETVGRKGGPELAQFLCSMEKEVRRRMKGACRRREELLRRMGKEGSVGLRHQLEGAVVRRRRQEEEPPLGGGVIMDWLTRDLQWDPSFTPPRIWELPSLLRYCGSVDPAHLGPLLQATLVDGSGELECLLTLVVSAHRPQHDAPVFSFLVAFLRSNVDKFRPEWQSVVEVFVGATREEVAVASSRNLVEELCVGGVALKLTQLRPPPVALQRGAWDLLAQNVIERTQCCDLPVVLQELRRQMEEEELIEVLTSNDAYVMWSRRFPQYNRREAEEHLEVACGVSHLLAFYFSVFGLNVEWMKRANGREVGAAAWELVERLPVEIASALRRNPGWSHLLPQFREMLREHLREEGVVSVGGVVGKFSYETQAEWDTFLHLINGAALECGGDVRNGDEPPGPLRAASFLRALIGRYGEEWTKSRVTPELWTEIDYSDVEEHSVGSLGSLLHSAITLGELDEVKRRSWPGLLRWRNGEGKTALELAREKLDALHPVRLLLQQLSSKLPLQTPLPLNQLSLQD